MTPLTPPGTRPTQLETLASTGGKPTASSVGKVTSEPEPTTVLTPPATAPATRTARASATVIRAEVSTMSAMDFELSPDHELIRRTVRDFAEQEVAPVAEELDRTKSFPYAIVAQLGELGLMGIPFPEEYGGAGADSLAYAIAVEELTRVDSSVAITLCAHTSLGTQPIYLFGSEEHKREWMPELTAGRRLGAFGLTEPEAGSDAGNTRTRARLEDGEWVIDGAKQFITNAGTDISGVVTITAATGPGTNGQPEISNLIVPTGTPGYEQGEPY